ncbi:hypothetical protein CRI70_01945 [Streptomyces sp. Ru87]|nr:hypothetical protein CRI70_01945 [Streptomyces sp. Ru87]
MDVNVNVDVDADADADADAVPDRTGCGGPHRTRCGRGTGCRDGTGCGGPDRLVAGPAVVAGPAAEDRTDWSRDRKDPVGPAGCRLGHHCGP